MKVYTLEFSFFSGAEWDYVTTEITATSLEQLKKAAINELQCIHEYEYELRVTPEMKWERIKTEIMEEELTFPIVKQLKY